MDKVRLQSSSINQIALKKMPKNHYVEASGALDSTRKRYRFETVAIFGRLEELLLAEARKLVPTTTIRLVEIGFGFNDSGLPVQKSEYHPTDGVVTHCVVEDRCGFRLIDQGKRRSTIQVSPDRLVSDLNSGNVTKSDYFLSLLARTVHEVMHEISIRLWGLEYGLTDIPEMTQVLATLMEDQNYLNILNACTFQLRDKLPSIDYKYPGSIYNFAGKMNRQLLFYTLNLLPPEKRLAFIRESLFKIVAEIVCRVLEDKIKPCLEPVGAFLARPECSTLLLDHVLPFPQQLDAITEMAKEINLPLVETESAKVGRIFHEHGENIFQTYLRLLAESEYEDLPLQRLIFDLRPDLFRESDSLRFLLSAYLQQPLSDE